MTTTLRLVERSELSQLEAKARSHKENALREWQAFVETVMEIYNRTDWQDNGLNWDAYCRKAFGISSARIRQYKAAVPYAEILEQATGYQPTENQVRVLREVVQDESQLITVYRNAAALYDGQPAKRHFVASLDVLRQAEATGAVSVGGEAMLVTPVTLDAATKEACAEADMRFREHKRSGEATAIKIILKRVGNRWEVEADGDLPDFVELIYWRKDNAQTRDYVLSRMLEREAEKRRELVDIRA
jgi:hypothetical protein